MVGGVIGVTVVFLGGPLLVLAIQSAAPRRALVDRRRTGRSARAPPTETLFVPAWQALRNSLEFAAIAAVDRGGGRRAGVGRDRVAARAGRRAAMDTLLMLPLGTSAVTVGFGFLVALDRWPVDLRAKAILVPIAQAVVAIPFVIRAVVPALRSIDPRLRDAATRARRAAPPGVARGRPADRDARVRGRVRVRGRGVARRVRRDAVRRPARHADDPDRDLAVPRAGPARSTSGRRWRCRPC